jgi:hypothetical protein
MQLYQSHKKVRAFKIVNILNRRTVSPTLKGEHDQVVVDGNYMRKHNPLVEGYYVRYESGYESWSPAEDFEGGYTEIEEEEDGDADQGLSKADGAGTGSDKSDKDAK